MIAKLTGLLDNLGDQWAIIDVQGVGYFVSCSAKTLSLLGDKGATVSLHIQTLVKEDDFQLFGFASLDEKEWFRLLLTVQGVGARMALALLSALAPSDIAQAIAAQDKTMLTRADGVGPKLAARLVTELKDKVQKMGLSSVEASPLSSLGGGKSASALIQQALSALQNLGYKRNEAYQAVALAQKTLGDEATLDHYIRHSLSQLARL